MAARPPITCHILDTTKGRPAAGVTCSIFYLGEPESVTQTDNVRPFAMGKTNEDGRVTEWVPNPGNTSELNSQLGIKLGRWLSLSPGVYKISFLTGQYFVRSGPENRTFFPFVDVHFTVDSTTEHYHIPLLLSNFSYTTYRGS